MKWNLYLGCADCHLWKSKEFANVGKLLTRQALLFSHKRGLLISRRNFCHPPEAFCCFLAKTSNIRGKLFPIFALNFSPKRLSSMACFSSRQNSCHPRDAFCWFRAKTSVVRDELFAVLAPKLTILHASFQNKQFLLLVYLMSRFHFLCCLVPPD